MDTQTECDRLMQAVFGPEAHIVVRERRDQRWDAVWMLDNESAFAGSTADTPAGALVLALEELQLRAQCLPLLRVLYGPDAKTSPAWEWRGVWRVDWSFPGVQFATSTGDSAANALRAMLRELGERIEQAHTLWIEGRKGVQR